jgi:hypothetical protein
MRINQLEKKLSAVYMLDGTGLALIKNVSNSDSVEDEDEDDNDVNFSDNDSENEEVTNTPETLQLILPSSITAACRSSKGLESFAEQESKLRIGQMNDALRELRLVLGEKSMTFRTKVCISCGIKWASD